MPLADRDAPPSSRDELRALQERKLRRLMEAAVESRFYRKKLAAAGVEAGSVRSPEDLLRVPFTTKAELVEAQRAEAPFGGLTTRPLSEYRYLFRTSGTSGRPLLWMDTTEDWETWMRCWGEVYRGAGVGRGDRVFLAFSFGPHISHWTAVDAVPRAGALRLPGGGMSSLQRLEAIETHECNVLVSTPTYALHLAEVARGQGIDLAAGPVETTIHAGEPGASVPNVRRRIEEAWGGRCFDHAGATEVGAWAFACGDREAIHLNEEEFLFEVVDTDGAPVPEGAPGELVATTLGRLGMPVLRYRTGDVVRTSATPCPCGRPLARIEGGVLGRADDMFIVRGVNLYPSSVDDLVRGVEGVAEYEFEVRRGEGLDRLLLRVEAAAETTFAELERSIGRAFRSRHGLRVEVQQAPAGSLPRYELKARRYRRS